MTSPAPARKTRRSFQINHRERAQAAREHPGTWVNVRSYEHYDNAVDVARNIRKGTYAAYQPPGAYASKVIEGPQAWPHRPFTVYCRYLGREA